MLYISVQPDQVYFIWQLEIQLRNFHSLGIAKEDIQVLVSYHKDKGLNTQFQEFMEVNNHLANFYAYPDLRVEPKYTSSIRPNILKQHFKKYPALEQETLFYHDSDILFSRIPQIEDVKETECCYVSDTRNYLDISYIRRASSEKLLDDMLRIVGLTKEKLEQEDSQTGGAQYILKGITSDFWGKVEKDAESLFVLMKDYNRQLWEKEYPDKKEFRSKKRGIQAWCADMWAVLWNLWLVDKNVKIHPEMDFSWPYSPVEDWKKKAIQHYSGMIEDKMTYFKKSEYKNYMPWYDDSLASISKATCSYKIVELIVERKKELDELRPKYRNINLVLHGTRLTPECQKIYTVANRYYSKLFDIPILCSFNDFHTSPKNADWSRIPTDQLNLAKLKEVNQLIWIPFNCIVSKNFLTQVLNTRFENPTRAIAVRSEESFMVDRLFTETFSKVLDDQLLHVNHGKFNSLEESDDQSPIVVHKIDDLDVQSGYLPLKEFDSPPEKQGDKSIADSIFYLT